MAFGCCPLRDFGRRFDTLWADVKNNWAGAHEGTARRGATNEVEEG
jgi:hypothetical protein